MVRFYRRAGRYTGVSFGLAGAALVLLLWAAAVSLVLFWPLAFVGGVLGAVVEAVWLVIVIAVGVAYWLGKR